MEKRQDRYYLYLRWPRYLAQWFAHEMYRLKNFESETLPPFRYDCDVESKDLDVVETRRGSIERIIIEQCLAKQPEAYTEAYSQGRNDLHPHSGVPRQADAVL